jgi:predicted DCC family thiol-disulfide oxidoreductase YuxK
MKILKNKVTREITVSGRRGELRRAMKWLRDGGYRIVARDRFSPPGGFTILAYRVELESSNPG